MKKVITGDDSETFYNEDYNETYHSRSGAVEEAKKKFVEPCKIRELAKKGHIKILDVGFGLGYNAIAAVDTALSENAEIEVISLEKDKSVVDYVKKVNPNLENFFTLERLEYDPLTETYNYEDKNIFLRIKLGEATKTIKKVTGKFDAVFLDAFSPPKNPELWTYEFFKEIKKRMKQSAILSTYSCARVVRDNLKKAGFEVWDGPVVGRRAPSTLARIKG